MPDELARGPEVALQVDLEGLAPRGLRRLGEGTEVRVRAGVVHQHVDLAELAHRLLDQGDALRFLSGMRGEDVRVRPEIDLLDLARRQHDLRAVLEKRLCDGRADAARRAGDD